MTVTISPQAQAILALCEKKIVLQKESEEINHKVRDLILKMKFLSYAQSELIIAMSEIDEQIERLAHSV